MEEGTDLLEDGEILEPSNAPKIVDQFSLSRATREPQTICSEESSNEKSDDSDEDSDSQCSKPKKVKPQAQLPVCRNNVPNKYKVWSIALQEETLMENLTKCDVEAMDRERSVESYNYKLVDKTDYSQYSGYRMPVSECHFIESDYVKCSDDKQHVVGSKRRHSDIKKRLGHKKFPSIMPLRLPNLAVTDEDSAEEIAEDIALKLHEDKVDLILNVVLVLGKEKAIELYNETKVVEENGGMLLMNGERRRTSGGVYLLLIKRDNTITSDAMKEIFSDDHNQGKRKKKKAHKRNRRKKAEEFKEQLIREKLLSLNTASFVQSPDTNKSDIPLETESNNLEEGELTVTNPPPSPATDQDTPPSRTLGAYSEDEVEHDNNHGATQSSNLCRKLVTYDDEDDDDYVDIDADEMDVF